MFFMGGTHFVQLGFQLAHIPLYFLYGGSVGTEKKIEIECNHKSMVSTPLTWRHVYAWLKQRPKIHWREIIV